MPSRSSPLYQARLLQPPADAAPAPASGAWPQRQLTPAPADNTATPAPPAATRHNKLLLRRTSDKHHPGGPGQPSPAPSLRIYRAETIQVCLCTPQHQPDLRSQTRVLKHLFHIGSLTCLLWMARWSYGQAEPTASRLSTVQIGASWFVSPDYGQQMTQGVSIYGTWTSPHRGIEGDIHRATSLPDPYREDPICWGRDTFRHVSASYKALMGFGRFHHCL
jgi:hypothetical protein